MTTIESISCRYCGARIVDTFQESVDFGVGTILGPKFFICENQHSYSPEQEASDAVDKAFKDAGVEL